MRNVKKTIVANDPFDLARFTIAQKNIYDQVLSELRDGRKRSHWMWYIFPQIDGLGYSATTKLYSIKSLEEAQKYLCHHLLGPRLIECAETVLHTEGLTVSEIFGSPDDMKLKSSMTLFATISEEKSVFQLVLDKFFQGKQDRTTLQLLQAMDNDD